MPFKADEIGNAKSLRPFLPKVLTPQCEEKNRYYAEGTDRRKQIIEERAKEKGWDVNGCQKHSAYRINGRNLCYAHAAHAALIHMVLMNGK